MRERGLSRLYGASGRDVGVLSVSYGVTVWTNGRVLCWHAGEHEVRLPAADPQNAARQLAELARAAL